MNTFLEKKDVAPKGAEHEQTDEALEVELKRLFKEALLFHGPALLDAWSSLYSERKPC